jgi:hypothetical protein
MTAMIRASSRDENGLVKMIVGPKLQPCEAVGFVAECGEPDHGQPRARRDLAAQRPSVDPRAHQVQDHRLAVSRSSRLSPCSAGGLERAKPDWRT